MVLVWKRMGLCVDEEEASVRTGSPPRLLLLALDSWDIAVIRDAGALLMVVAGKGRRAVDRLRRECHVSSYVCQASMNGDARVGKSLAKVTGGPAHGGCVSTGGRDGRYVIHSAAGDGVKGRWGR